VASVRYLGAVHFKAQAYTASPEEASQLATRIDTFMDIFRTAESSVSQPGLDPDQDVILSKAKDLCISRHDPNQPPPRS
jgi:hypothetical protein